MIDDKKQDRALLRPGSLIAHIDLNGKTHILAERKNGWFQGPTLSPDGQHLAYSLETAATNIWLLENL